MNNSLAAFENYKIRRVYDENKEAWYFSIIDIIQVLTQQDDYQTARKYWNKLKERLKNEGSQTVTSCHQLKMEAEDGKMRETDCANTQSMFRLIQSIPSPKAERRMSLIQRRFSVSFSQSQALRQNLLSFGLLKLGTSVCRTLQTQRGR